MSALHRPVLRNQLLNSGSNDEQPLNIPNSQIFTSRYSNSDYINSTPQLIRSKTPGEIIGSPNLSRLRSSAIREGAAVILNQNSSYSRVEPNEYSNKESPVNHSKERTFKSPEIISKESNQFSYMRSETVLTEFSIPNKPARLSININSLSNNEVARPLAGIGNIGNSCYMACILQCLCYSDEFVAVFTRSSISAQVNSNSQLQGRFAIKFCDFIEAMGKHTKITPLPLKSLISRIFPSYRGSKQQDAGEFLRAVLEILHEDLNRVRDKPIYKDLSSESDLDIEKIANLWWSYSLSRDHSAITDLFQGQTVTTMTCTLCTNNSVSCDTFLNIALELPKSGSTTLSTCFDFHTRRTSLLDTYKCEKCKKTKACYQQTFLLRFPKILIIQLKRFSIINNSKVKLLSSLDIPEALDLSSYLHPSVSDSPGRYILSSIAHHQGSLNSGHYIR